MEHESDFLARLERDGFAIADHVIPSELIADLKQAIGAVPDDDSVRRRSSVYGIRNLFESCREVVELARSSPIRRVMEPVLGAGCFAVRATFFDKAPDANWNLGWHQDTVICVRDRVDTPGFTAWAEKAGVQQVRPPLDVLQQMLAVRVHLDQCSRHNGPLRVRVGSHARSWQPDALSECKAQHAEQACEVERGGLLVMRPLLVHASSPSDQPAHRRVIHLEFAAGELPGRLEWRSRVA